MAILNVQHENTGGNGVVSLTGLVTLNPYTVPTGDNKKLIITFSTKSTAVPPLAGNVTAFGNACTFIASRVEGAGPANRVEIYELDLGSTTPSGDIAATWSASTAVSVTVRTVTDVLQQAPEATAVNSSASATSLNTNITTLTANAVILDGSAVSNDGTAAITQGPDQVLDVVEAITSGSQLYGYGASHRIGGAAGSHTLGWSSTGTSRYVQVLVAYEAGAGGGGSTVVTVKMPAPNMTGLNWYWHDALAAAPTDSVTDGSASSDGSRDLSATLSNTTLTTGQTGHMIVTASSGALIGIAKVTVP